MNSWLYLAVHSSDKLILPNANPSQYRPSDVRETFQQASNAAVWVLHAHVPVSRTGLIRRRKQRLQFLSLRSDITFSQLSRTGNSGQIP